MKLNKKEKYYSIVCTDGPEDDGYWMAHEGSLRKARVEYKKASKHFLKDKGGFIGSKPEILLVKVEKIEKITILNSIPLKKMGEV